MRRASVWLIFASVVWVGICQGREFSEVAEEAQQVLVAAKKELAERRLEIAQAKPPLSRTLTALENELLQLRKAVEASEEGLAEALAEKALAEARVADLRKWYQEEKATLGGFGREFSTKVNLAQFQEYASLVDEGEAQAADKAVSPSAVLEGQLRYLSAALANLRETVGGGRYEGMAVTEQNEGGVMGQFFEIGPFSYFSDGVGVSGNVRERLNDAYPYVDDRGIDEAIAMGLRALAQTGKGSVPIDPTLGHKERLLNAEETLWQHIVNGGITMVPLLGLFVVAIGVAIGKLIEIWMIRVPEEGDIDAIVAAVNGGSISEAKVLAERIPGPFGLLVQMGVAQHDQEREILEESLFERMLAAQPLFERYLSFLALVAASAPLLGLLGTVTGMIQTFKAINQVGTGDPAVLSDGISVALITTEYGLIVAVPCLMAHVLLNRFAKSKMVRMEQVAVALANGFGR